MSDYNYIDIVRLCNKTAWEIADRREKKMSVMSDLISRQAAIDAIKRYESAYSYDLNNGLILAMNAVADDVPTIDPVKHGEWIDWHYSGFDGIRIWRRECSVCGYERDDDNPDKDTPYCPYCGAQMENPV